jgi:sulfate transporter 4
MLEEKVPMPNNSDSQSGSPPPSTRQRITTHRQSLLQIRHDASKGPTERHEVPDIRNSAARRGQEYAESVDESPEGWVHAQASSMRATLSQRSCKDWTSTLLPFFRWMQTYDFKSNILTDIMAGVTVGVMVIPQSMSYAKLAGLPVEYGLYSAFVPVYAYSLWGSSQQLAIGPVALVSLILNAGILVVMEKEGYTPEDTENYDEIYATLALQTSFLAGVSFLTMGLLRLGFVTIFLSHAVVSGFTSAAAIVIGLSQIKYIFGYSIPNDKELHKVLKNIFASIDQFNWKTFLFGTSCLAILWGIKQLAAKVPKLKWMRPIGPLLVTTIGITFQAAIDLEQRGIPIVGHIPSGFPKFTANVVFPLADVGNISAVTLSIVIVGFMESIAIAKSLASKHNYELDSSLELVGLGMANLSSGLFGGYPVVGSFSRSAVNNDSGAKSQISGLVSATMVGMVLLFLTPVFELLVRCYCFSRHCCR